MRQTAEHRSYGERRGTPSFYAPTSVSHSWRRRPGFTLIEVVIAMAILMIITISVLMLTTVSASSMKDSEMRDMGKNIATYTVEYLRSRNVTSDNNFISDLDGSHWFDPQTNSAGVFPGLVDLGKSPVESNGSVVALTNNTHPALPDRTFGGVKAVPAAFYSSLQGYVSLADSPANSTPSSEDGNASVLNGQYFDRTTGVPYVVRFPLKNAAAIKNFTALSGYSPMIYTSSANCVDPSKPEYDPHYTASRTGTMAYRGFRVLTQIVARSTVPSGPVHVQYFDVKVTVFWILGIAEHSYSLSTQIITYGVS